MARKPECSRCGQLKEAGRENESCCKKCKSIMRSARAAKKRAEEGLLPWGEGRKHTCSKCGNFKETRNTGYCRKCQNENEKAKYAEKTRDPLFVAQRKEIRRIKYQTNVRYKMQRQAHLEVSRALERGMLEKLPCEVCGERIVDAHHDDYSNPLNVRWLCRSHHLEHHRGNKHQSTEDYLLGES